MRKFIKDNFIVILAILLPMVFLLTLISVIYIPSLFVSTDYNFLYTCKNQLDYSVIDGNLKFEDREGRIFLYDTDKNYSREISLEKAEEKTISPISTSPDGVNFVSRQPHRDDFFYYRRRDYNYFLENKRGSKKLDLIGCNLPYRRDNIDFIGWVLNNN